ncbi:hypothetical protein C8F01DRAFT_241853 [Mycena amicta]|nr:hypothetical protein C8F01DRAFT_241853 [Mycena amicta]
MLRADPSNLDGTGRTGLPHEEHVPFDQSSSFPSTSFNFSFPPYEGLFSTTEYSGSAPSRFQHSSSGFHAPASSSPVVGRRIVCCRGSCFGSDGGGLRPAQRRKSTGR